MEKEPTDLELAILKLIFLTIGQILFHSLEKNYFMTNLPWLIGSLGTMAEDAIIFVQFRMFGDGAQTAAVE